MPPTPLPGRRELNKARTREAIVVALRDLVERLPVGEITVDQVADRADISRRTFFNYFGSIPAVLSAVFAEHAAGMLEQIEPTTFGTDPIAALRELVQRVGMPIDFLGWLAVLGHQDGPTEAAMLIERAVWSDLAAWLEGRLRDAQPEADPLYISTLAAAVMSSFKAAEDAWASSLSTPEALSDADIESFHDHLDRALGHLAQGWRSTT